MEINSKLDPPNRQKNGKNCTFSSKKSQTIEEEVVNSPNIENVPKFDHRKNAKRLGGTLNPQSILPTNEHDSTKTSTSTKKVFPEVGVPTCNIHGNNICATLPNTDSKCKNNDNCSIPQDQNYEKNDTSRYASNLKMCSTRDQKVKNGIFKNHNIGKLPCSGTPTSNENSTLVLEESENITLPHTSRYSSDLITYHIESDPIFDDPNIPEHVVKSNIRADLPYDTQVDEDNIDENEQTSRAPTICSQHRGKKGLPKTDQKYGTNDDPEVESRKEEDMQEVRGKINSCSNSWVPSQLILEDSEILKSEVLPDELPNTQKETKDQKNKMTSSNTTIFLEKKSNFECGIYYRTFEKTDSSSNLFQINTFFNSLPIRIIGTEKHPMFYAEDLGRLLGIARIRDQIKYYSEHEIVAPWQKEMNNVTTYRTNGRKHDRMVLLSEFGLYRLLMNNKSQIGETFRTWVYEVLWKIRINGAYKYAESETIEALKLTNEKLLIESNKHKEYIKELELKQQSFKNLCEKIHIFEIKNNPKWVKLERNLPEHDQFSDDSGEEDEFDYIDNWDAYSKDFPLEAAQRLYSYKLSIKPTPEDFTKYNTVFSLYVRDSKKVLENLKTKLYSYLCENPTEKSAIFFCTKETILETLGSPGLMS